jgi:type II secretion system protein H
MAAMGKKAAKKVMPTSRIGNRRGFTLLELMVVLAIMLIMSGVVVESIMPALNEARLRSSTSMTIAALRYARSYAVTHRTRAAMVLNTGRQGLSVQIPETDESGEETWRVITTPAGRYRSLPEGVTIEVTRPEMTDQDATPPGTMNESENQETVTFTALGQAEDTRITLRDEHDNSRVIRVDAITGHCELVSEEP